MNSAQILAEIREANLGYLMLAQTLVRADREQALFRLGIGEETAALLESLSPAQILKVAAGNTLLCQFRMNDDIVWDLITSHGRRAANDTSDLQNVSAPSVGRRQEAA
jgi:flagellar transcriptional activator FlhD